MHNSQRDNYLLIHRKMCIYWFVIWYYLCVSLSIWHVHAATSCEDLSPMTAQCCRFQKPVEGLSRTGNLLFVVYPQLAIGKHNDFWCDRFRIVFLKYHFQIGQVLIYYWISIVIPCDTNVNDNRKSLIHFSWCLHLSSSVGFAQFVECWIHYSMILPSSIIHSLPTFVFRCWVFALFKYNWFTIFDCSCHTTAAALWMLPLIVTTTDWLLNSQSLPALVMRKLHFYGCLLVRLVDDS